MATTLGHTPVDYGTWADFKMAFEKQFIPPMLRSCTLMYDLYKIAKASTLKETEWRVFERFKDDLEW